MNLNEVRPISIYQEWIRMSFFYIQTKILEPNI